MRNSLIVSTVLAIAATNVSEATLITFSKVVTNNTSSTQSYEFLQTAFFTSSYSIVGIRGGLSVALTDFTGNGATLTPEVGTPVPSFYTAWINSNVVNSLGTTAMLAPIFGISTLNQSFGSPVLETAIVDPVNIMQMRLRFLLSPGDQVAISGTFETTPIPTPASAIILICSAVTARRRRR